MRSHLVVLLSLLALTGCASVPMAAQPANHRAKMFEAPEDEAAIYVFREGTFGSALTIPVYLNGKMSGALAYNTFFRWDVEAGQHKIASQMQNYHQIELTADPGEILFVETVLRMGWMKPRVELVTVPADEAKPAFRRMDLAADQR